MSDTEDTDAEDMSHVACDIENALDYAKDTHDPLPDILIHSVVVGYDVNYEIWRGQAVIQMTDIPSDSTREALTAIADALRSMSTSLYEQIAGLKDDQ